MTALSRMETFKQDDVGTRRDHLMELQELWVDALSIVIDQIKYQRLEQGYPEDSFLTRKEHLEIALNLLECYLTESYSSEADKKLIDSIGNQPENWNGLPR